MKRVVYDIVIVGSGARGGTVAQGVSPRVSLEPLSCSENRGFRQS